MLLIGGPNQLPVDYFDPSTCTIPAVIQYGLTLLELVNWHDLLTASEDTGPLISDKLEGRL